MRTTIGAFAYIVYVTNSNLTRLIQPITSKIKALTERFVCHLRYRKALREVEKLPDSILRDIGILHRSQIESHLKESFKCEMK
jgi:uncharacterized protein YjiS (DUF1127 family)